jgi:hypothetical protein
VSNEPEPEPDLVRTGSGSLVRASSRPLAPEAGIATDRYQALVAAATEAS